MSDVPLFFALGRSAELGSRVAAHFDSVLSEHEEREFAGGEHKVRPLVEVAGHRVCVLHSLYGDNGQSANDKLCRLLFFIGALRDAGARYITALVPYMAYARKDRRTKPQDPVTTRYVAKLFSALKVDAVFTLGVHNPSAEQNAFDCLYRDLNPAPLFADYFAQRRPAGVLTVLAPDTGGVKNAQYFQQELEARGLSAELAFMTKTRSQGIVTSSPLFGEVKNRSVIIYDDLISSGTTIGNALEQCRLQAREVFVAATHGAFTREVEQLFGAKGLVEVVVSDSVESDQINRQACGDRLRSIDTSSLFAQCVRKLGG